MCHDSFINFYHIYNTEDFEIYKYIISKEYHLKLQNFEVI